MFGRCPASSARSPTPIVLASVFGPSVLPHSPPPSSLRGADYPGTAQQLAGSLHRSVPGGHRRGGRGHHRGAQPPQRRSHPLGRGSDSHPAAGGGRTAARSPTLRSRRHRGRPIRELRDRGPALSDGPDLRLWQERRSLVASLPGEQMSLPRTGRAHRLGLGLCAVIGLAVTPGVAHGQG